MDWFKLCKGTAGDFTFIPACQTKASAGVAISYVWGAPPYSQHDVSLLDLATRTTTARKKIKLGSFWSLSDFVSGLWNATQGSPFWLDQLSMPQDKTIRRTLLKEVPSIYKQHPVRVLINSSKCDVHTRWNTLNGWSDAQILEEREEFQRHLVQCTRCLQLYPWLTRLWPRQEAYYARELRFVYLEHGKQGIEAVQERQTFPEKTLEYIPNLDAMLADKLNTPLLRSQVSLEEFQWRDHTPAEIAAYVAEFQLLRGDTVHFEKEVDFSESLTRLGQLPKQVTDQKDLVLAVWCDMPGYVIPSSVDSMQFIQLLQDATDQYTRITGRQIPVMLSAGLASVTGPSMQSVLCRVQPSCKDTMSWYSQWRRPGQGVQIDADGLVRGSVSEEAVVAKSLAEFLDRHSTLMAIKTSFTRHTTLDELLILYRQLIHQIRLVQQNGEPVYDCYVPGGADPRSVHPRRW